MKKKSHIHAVVLGAAHEYTREKVPWKIGSYGKECGRLCYYLSGGGMRAFGRTVKQEKARICQRKFLIVAAAIWLIWLAFWLF